MSKGFKKWCLPSKYNGIRRKTREEDYPEIFKDFKKICDLFDTFKDSPSEEQKDRALSEIEILSHMVLRERSENFWKHYNDIAFQKKGESDDEEEQDENEEEEEDTDQEEDDQQQDVVDDQKYEDEEAQLRRVFYPERSVPVQWDGYQAKTMVSHMIYSQNNGEPKVRLNHEPLKYLLEDPRTGRGENVVQVYRGVDSRTREYRLPMLMIWDNIKEFMELDSGEFITEILRTPDGSAISEEGLYAQQQMLKLKDVMSTSVLTGHNTGHFLGVQYRGDMLNSLHFTYDTGDIVMKVCDGIPDLGDMHPAVCPKNIASIVNASLQKWKDSSPGLFVSIVWTSTNGDKGEHYLYLCEYQHAKLHATIARGFENEWLQTNPTTGNPLFNAKQVAIDSNTKTLKTAYNTWQVPTSLAAWDVVKDLIEYMSEYDSSGFMLEIINDFEKLIADDYDEEQEEQEDDELKTRPKHTDVIQPYFFSGDNLTFLVVLFNTEYDFIRDMLDLDSDDTRTGWYVMCLVVRYPILNINIDQVMINVRRKYFMRYSPNKWKWEDWRDGRWHIPGDRHWDDPQQYQQEPDEDDPLDRVIDRDSRGNIVYPLRFIFHLPYKATYQFLITKRKFMSFDYCVNNLDMNDPEVVYKYINEDEDEALWNDIQMFRINAEVKISRLGYNKHNESFFAFRKQFVSEGGTRFPFKLYLAKYPDLLQEWRLIWEKRWPDMHGWVKSETDGSWTASSLHPSSGVHMNPKTITPQREPLINRILAKQKARALSERRQNEKFMLHRLYDSFKTQSTLPSPPAPPRRMRQAGSRRAPLPRASTGPRAG